MGNWSQHSYPCLSACYILLQGPGTVASGNIYCQAAPSYPGWSILAPYSGLFSCTALPHLYIHYMLHVECFQILLGLF